MDPSRSLEEEEEEEGGRWAEEKTQENKAANGQEEMDGLRGTLFACTFSNDPPYYIRFNTLFHKK